MSSARLPVGILVPTLNCRTELAGFLPGLESLAALAEEVVVVDSFSEDGTVDYLKAHLRHPRLSILDHPRGIYASWNFGLQRLTAKYAYIATVGDVITTEGLQHLTATAEELGSDLVISAPRFFDAEGKPVEARRWPVHTLLDWSATQRPARVEPWLVFLLAALDLPDGILGSSASNLYRTETLKRFPFPTDYGHAGDTAWGIRYAFRTALAVTPQVISRFIIHPTAVDRMDDRAHEALANRLIDLVDETAREVPSHGAAVSISEEARALSGSAAKVIRNVRESQRRYEAIRHHDWPWYLQPSGWQARANYKQARAEVRAIKERIRKYARKT